MHVSEDTDSELGTHTYTHTDPRCLGTGVFVSFQVFFNRFQLIRGAVWCSEWIFHHVTVQRTQELARNLFFFEETNT